MISNRFHNIFCRTFWFPQCARTLWLRPIESTSNWMHPRDLRYFRSCLWGVARFNRSKTFEFFFARSPIEIFRCLWEWWSRKKCPLCVTPKIFPYSCILSQLYSLRLKSAIPSAARDRTFTFSCSNQSFTTWRKNNNFFGSDCRIDCRSGHSSSFVFSPHFRGVMQQSYFFGLK